MPDIRKISPELAKKAEVELHENPERIQEDIDAIKAWLAKMPHIKSRMDDQFLATFLRGCKYSLERVKEKLDMFYTMRTAIPEIFTNRDPLEPKTLELIKMGIFVPLPITETPDSPRILLMRMGLYDPAQYKVEDVMKANIMVNDIMMKEDDNFVIGGQIGIMDMANVTMAHFVQFTPSLMKKMSMLGQDATPLRQKGFHHVNTPPGFETIFNIFKTFMNEKMKSRLYVHGSDMQALHKYVPKRLLPSEYGGEAGPLEDIIKASADNIIAHRDYLISDEEYRTDEKKRPGKPKTAETLFGLEGSFRKLEVD